MGQSPGAMNSTPPASFRTSGVNPTQTQFCPFFALQTGLVKGKGPATICRKSLSLKVPETGLEPALPLQEPGPQPGASANSATPAHTAFMLVLRVNADLPPGYVDFFVRSPFEDVEGIFAIRDTKRAQFSSLNLLYDPRFSLPRYVFSIFAGNTNILYSPNSSSPLFEFRGEVEGTPSPSPFARNCPARCGMPV